MDAWDQFGSDLGDLCRAFERNGPGTRADRGQGMSILLAHMATRYDPENPGSRLRSAKTLSTLIADLREALDRRCQEETPEGTRSPIKSVREESRERRRQREADAFAERNWPKLRLYRPEDGKRLPTGPAAG